MSACPLRILFSGSEPGLTIHSELLTAPSKLHLVHFRINCKLISKLMKCNRAAIAGLEIYRFELCGVCYLGFCCFLKLQIPFYS